FILFHNPLRLIFQLLLLHIYFSLFLYIDIFSHLNIVPLIKAFSMFIILPLIFALLLQFFSSKSKTSNQILQLTAWLTEIFMSFVLFSVVGSQINKIIHN